MPEPRIASHADQPEASLAERLLLALGMWPDYVEQLGADALIEAAVLIRSDAHRYPMVCEDYGAKCTEVDDLRTTLKRAKDEFVAPKVGGRRKMIELIDAVLEPED